MPKGSWLGKKETIKGELEKIVFCNEENHFTIACIRMDKDEVTIVGNIYPVSIGETLQLTGEWVRHKSFGFQFKVETWLAITPSTANGIERYLGSGFIKGIGPVMAKRLVAKFGNDTLDVIENSIEDLRRVEGIGDKRLEMISNAWKDQREIRDVMVFLQTHKVSPAYAMKIFRQYGKKSIEVVRENPFRLAMEVSGIGFKMADQIAGNLGIDPKSPCRIEAGIFYALLGQSEKGHIYFPYEMLVAEGKKLLEVEEELLDQALEKLFQDRRIAIEDLGEGDGRVRAVYPMPVFIAEKEIASSLIKLRDHKKNKAVSSDEAFESAIHGMEKKMGIQYAPAQIEAMKKVWSGEKALVITGGPGTGKTTIIKSLLSIFKREGKRVLLAAPTGRAAKRMTEATGVEAKTIHRLLEYNFKKGGFLRGKEMQLEADVSIIDEASMIDNFLMFHLIKAIPSEATLIIIGDVDQLPSVGPGNVLRDIISSGAVSVVFLNEIFRQSQVGLIVRNAHRINRGEFPILPEKGEKEKLGDFFFFKSDTPEDSLKWIIDLCKDRIPGKFPHIDREDIQVITPMNRGMLGAANLNVELQAALNPKGKEITRGGRIFRVGDRIMQIRNNYDKLVFNGDLGRVTGIDLEEQELETLIDGVRVVYGFDELDQLVLAYAITVHKSQGSEYEAVVLPMAMEHYMLLQRNLFYTVVTRAKKLVVIVGGKQAMGIAVKNDKIRERYTWLAERLRVLQTLITSNSKN
ncbi:MAG: ATP-dependent RecD-like DNA helicase [Nitrospinae bacterium]|nr:ATP-dependent RecD-like DNA helicase [Nitrospinota bacterium]